jgi:hypothetical protein
VTSDEPTCSDKSPTSEPTVALTLLTSLVVPLTPPTGKLGALTPLTVKDGLRLLRQSGMVSDSSDSRK